jgi:hypothetical protein
MVRCYASSIGGQRDEVHSADMLIFLCRACACHIRACAGSINKPHTGAVPTPTTLVFEQYAHQLEIQQFSNSCPRIIGVA